MTQIVTYWIGEQEVKRELPDAERFVAPGIAWGEHWLPFTPAYWLSQVWMNCADDRSHSPYHAQGTLAEEVTFCLLSGYGITAELATAAFEACRNAALISSLNVNADDWTEVLKVPMQLGDRTASYRYPNQKGKYLADAMQHIQEDRVATTGGRALRDSLMGIRGIGPKTAGFIARNFLDADDVAILDIHIVRAGLLCDLFRPEQKVESHYFEMEKQYIDFCRSMHVRPAVLDCIIWEQMRTLGRFALDAVKRKLGQQLTDPDSAPVPRQLRLRLPVIA
ncbi:hypothetical protein ACAX43_29250 [Paraburkholderia sp. IW21]|uniref:8-oxoguanine DNA glycosylase n=1 Tax=Paraburkholderia sp. IW21 TaxID=3242488 RepID=UPI003521D5A4